MLDVSVSKRLGAFAVDAAFAAAAGITALFGPSGAGKTSLVNMIAGLLRPDDGRIAVNERVLFDAADRINVPTRRRRLGYVFQDGLLFPHLTIRQNLLYGRRLAPRTARSPRFDQVIALLGIEALVERRPRTLSGGEKQRVAIGRALLASPEILLLDEPLASLDAARKAEILPYIARLRDEMALPIVYVSHSIEEITRLADTVVILANGTVAAAGPIEAVTSRLDLMPFTDPAEAGAVITVRVAEHDDDYDLTTLAFPGGSLRVPRIDTPVGGSLRIRLRARDVVLAVEPPHGLSIRNVLAGQIVQAHQGDGPFAEFAIDVGGTRIVAGITRMAAQDLGLAPGRQVYVLIKSVALERRALPGMEPVSPMATPTHRLDL